MSTWRGVPATGAEAALAGARVELRAMLRAICDTLQERPADHARLKDAVVHARHLLELGPVDPAGLATLLLRNLSIDLGASTVNYAHVARQLDHAARLLDA